VKQYHPAVRQNLIEFHCDRHFQSYPTRLWRPWSVSWAWSDGTRIPPNVGNLLYCVRRYQGSLWRASDGQYRQPQEPTISSGAGQGISAPHPGTPVGAAHSICHDCWCRKFNLYKSTLGHKNTVHGAHYSPSIICLSN
jgi:hypothetical protein